MNKLCMYLLFACVALATCSYAPTKPVSPSYKPAPAPAPAPAPIPEPKPAPYASGYWVSPASGVQYGPAVTYTAIAAPSSYGSGSAQPTQYTIQQSQPQARSQAYTKNAPAPTGLYYNYAVPSYKIVDINVEPNYYNAPQYNVAPAYQLPAVASNY